MVIFYSVLSPWNVISSYKLVKIYLHLLNCVRMKWRRKGSKYTVQYLVIMWWLPNTISYYPFFLQPSHYHCLSPVYCPLVRFRYHIEAAKRLPSYLSIPHLPAEISWQTFSPWWESHSLWLCLQNGQRAHLDWAFHFQSKLACINALSFLIYTR